MRHAKSRKETGVRDALGRWVLTTAVGRASATTGAAVPHGGLKPTRAGSRLADVLCRCIPVQAVVTLLTDVRGLFYLGIAAVITIVLFYLLILFTLAR